MKRRFLILILLVYSGFFVFAMDTYNEISGSGLFIDSVPANAKVFIDGVERGLTPYNASSIRSGEYNIRIEKEGYAVMDIDIKKRSMGYLETTMQLPALLDSPDTL